MSSTGINRMTKKPLLLVFDLDYTLWPFWVDTHVTPPFRKGDNNKIVDANNQTVKCYPEVPDVLRALHSEGYQLGVASRTSEIEGANQLIDLFDWDRYFRYRQIFPGGKVTHFNNIHKEASIPFADMIFFDDEKRNIDDLVRHGVMSILVKNGVNKEVVRRALEEYGNNR